MKHFIGVVIILSMISNLFGEVKESSESKFWSWFKDNISKLEKRNGPEDPILDILLEKLQACNKDFSFELSTNKEKELIQQPDKG